MLQQDFTKIHIDTSMKVNSDPEDVRLSDEIIAGRGAHLAKVAEETYKELLERDPESNSAGICNRK